MNSQSLFATIPGGQSIIDWFGYVPRFHDANILEMNLEMNGPFSMRIHGWKMTDKKDSKGYFVLEKHAVISVGFALVRHVDLRYFDSKGIISNLEFSGTLEKTEMA